MSFDKRIDINCIHNKFGVLKCNTNAKWKTVFNVLYIYLKLILSSLIKI